MIFECVNKVRTSKNGGILWASISEQTDSGAKPV